MVSGRANQKRIARLERRIDRLEKSVSIRLGSHIVKAMRQPWRAPFLIISLPWLMVRCGLEMLGKLPSPSAGKKINNKPPSEPLNNTVIMFPTNGVGFGHFTRMLALAKRMKNRDPDLEVIFFTTMPTLHLLKPYGIPCHHISGPKNFKNLESSDWNALLEEELTICFETHKPKMFIFDGAFPYRGMLRATSANSTLQKVWMRRGMFRTGSSIPVDSISHFDLIIHPQDSVTTNESKLDHDVETLRSPPIVLLDENELLDRDSARNRLMLPQTSKVVYVQLGAGQINQIDSEVRLTVEALIAHPDVHVVLGESLLGDRLMIDLPRVHLVRDYPNSMYFRAFDATVQAGGYNSYHETKRFGLPALFYPNMNTGMDDQLARCKAAEREGWGQVIVERDEQSIKQGISKLLDKIGNYSPEQVEKPENGADKLAIDLKWYMDTGKCFNEGWMLPTETLNWVQKNIKKGSKILEFGSGHGSHTLSQDYQLWSIEHDVDWIGICDSNYILANICDNPISTENGEMGWYDPELFSQIPDDFELIIIDGPPGSIGRAGILNHLKDMPSTTWIMIDDSDRDAETNLVTEFDKFYSPMTIDEIESEHSLRTDGTKRASTVLKIR
jgi:hypothetical protein